MSVIAKSYQDKLIIERFTYDWLIRFAELFRVDIGFRSEHEEYKPINSRLARTSPLFKAVLNLHAPVIIKPYDLNFTNNRLNMIKLYNGCLIPLSIPKSYKRVVVITKRMCFDETQAGVISELIKKRVFCADAVRTSAYDANFTPAEFKYVIQQTHEKLMLFDCCLTEPVKFSTIWPRLKHINNMNLNITNLVFDEGMIRAMRYKPWTVRATRISLHCCDVYEDEIIAVVECYLSFPQFPTYACWHFKPEYKKITLQPIADRIIQRMIAAGYIWNNRNGVFLTSELGEGRKKSALKLITNNKMFYFE